MAKSKRLTDDQILSFLRFDIDASEEVAEIESADNATMYKYYRAKKLGNEVEGKSKIVSTDVFETVEWLSPQLSDIFSEQNGVPNMVPHGVEDRDSAELMEELIRYQFYRQNEGEDLLMDLVQDCLMYRPGAIVKWKWEKTGKTEKSNLTGITEDELLMLAAHPEVSISGYEETEAGYDVNISRTNVDYDGPRFELLPPWEFLRHPNYKNIVDSPFVAHRKRVTLDYLNRMEKVGFYKNIEDIRAGSADKFTGDTSEQEIYNQDGLDRDDEPVPDEARREVVIYECYVKIDINQDGQLEDRIVTICGNNVIRNVDNVYGRPPFTIIKCIKDTHKFSGIPIAEFMKDLQRLNTFMLRQLIDNIAQSNNSRKVLNPKTVNMADVMDNRPGASIRVKDGVDVRQALMELPTQQVNGSVVNFFGLSKELGEQRTGVSKIFKSSGDPHNQTAAGQYAALNQANSRIRKMAKIMANGLKDLFRGMILMNKKFMTQEQVLRVTNDREVTITPDDLEGKIDIEVNVLIGASSKQQQIQNMMQLLSVGSQIQALFPILDGENLPEIWKEIVKNQGYKDLNRFLPAALKPENSGKQPPQPAAQGQPGKGPPQASNLSSVAELAAGAGQPNPNPQNPAALPQVLQ